MDDLAQILQAYRSMDIAAWVATYRLIPVLIGIPLILIGALIALFGGRYAPRAICALVGTVAAVMFIPMLMFHFPLLKLNLGVVTVVGALIGGVGGLLFPPVGVFVAAGLPIGLLVGQLVGTEDWAAGFFPGLLLAGGLAAAVGRP